MKKFYITTAIDYANAAPHLGHAYEKVAADVCARYHRMLGDETFFLTGTDEHGAKIARAAQKAGVSPEKFVEGNRAQFQNLLSLLSISNDDFIFTADKIRHWPGVQKVWEKLQKNGDLYKAKYKGLYCVGHEAFVTEKDLINGVCADHNQKPEVVEEENYFFRLSKYIPQVIEAIENDMYRIMPESRKNEVLAFLKEGVEDISFSRPSRDISWGVPVPGDSDHTIYVWADALPNYISALGYGGSNESLFKKFWPADVHLIGKDILRFHAIYWPAMLMALGLPFPKALMVHGIIRSGGQKMSKTIGNVIDPVVMANEYGADALRYFLMREIPFGEDGDFTESRFQDVYEGNLAHGIGNLASRVAAMIEKYFDSEIKKPSDKDVDAVPTTRTPGREEAEDISSYFQKEVSGRYHTAMKDLQLTNALTMLSGFFTLLDGYIQDYEPYRLVKTDPEKAKAVLWVAAVNIVETARLLAPFMPNTRKAIELMYGTKDVEEISLIRIGERQALFPSKK